jgi:hypothetical protein
MSFVLVLQAHPNWLVMAFLVDDMFVLGIGADSSPDLSHRLVTSRNWRKLKRGSTGLNVLNLMRPCTADCHKL